MIKRQLKTKIKIIISALLVVTLAGYLALPAITPKVSAALPSSSYVNLLVNGSFDDPLLAGASTNLTTMAAAAAANRNSQFPSKFVPGWESTDATVELWANGFAPASTGGQYWVKGYKYDVPNKVGTTTAQDQAALANMGKVYCELLATKWTSLYQTVPTEPGVLYAWSATHGGRLGFDACKLQLNGSDQSYFYKNDSYDSALPTNMTDGIVNTVNWNTDPSPAYPYATTIVANWGTYLGYYMPAAGVTDTEFRLVPVSATDQNKVVRTPAKDPAYQMGNLVDDLQFYEIARPSTQYRIDTDTSTSLALPAAILKDTSSTAIYSIGAVTLAGTFPAGSSTNAAGTPLNQIDFSVPGTYKINVPIMNGAVQAGTVVSTVIVKPTVTIKYVTDNGDLIDSVEKVLTLTNVLDPNGIVTGYAYGNIPPVLSLNGSGYAVTEPNIGDIKTYAGDGLDYIYTGLKADDPPTGTMANKDITVTFIYALPPFIGDVVWYDTNMNGIQDPGEPGIPGVTVQLLAADKTTVLKETQTDGSGQYLFSALTAGETYYVKFIAPDGYAFTLQAQGGDTAADSDPDQLTGMTGQITLTAGETNYDIDAGLTAELSIGDFVWNDLNANGIQDTGEPGVANVTVKLLESDGVTMLRQPQTDSSGKYIFDGLAAGSYYMQFENLPAGYRFSPAKQGSDDTVDSDVVTYDTVAMTGKTGKITVFADNLNIDAGIYSAPSIGDFVWNDQNKNGIQDPGEPGVAGVKADLLDSGNNIVATTTTDAAGMYLFDFLEAGKEYRVRFDISTLTGKYAFTQPNMGSPSTNSRAVPVTASTAVTDLVILQPGQGYLSLDAGLYLSTVSFTFIKTDEAGDPLQNVQFNLYSCSLAGDPAHLEHSEIAEDVPGNCWYTDDPATASSDENGAVTFTLTPGEDYMLAETATVPGCELPTGQWLIRYDPALGENGEMVIKAHGKVMPPAFEDPSAENGYQYTLVNFNRITLPLTGGTADDIVVYGEILLGLGSLLCAAYLYSLRRRPAGEYIYK